MKNTALFILVFLIFSCNKKEKQENKLFASTILINGNVWTGNQNQPKAQAFAIKDNKIIKVGSNDDVIELKNSATQVVDAKGAFVTPGFIDSHVHFLAGGLNLQSLLLRKAKTKEQFISLIADYAKTLKKGEWILGGEWDHNNWGGELPNKSWIDSVTPNNPMFIRRLDGHMGLANSNALNLANIISNTKEVEGGEIIRDVNNEPLGILKDNAMNILLNVIPDPTQEKLNSALHSAMDFVASKGVTSVHQVAGIAPKGYIETFKNAAKNKELITRIYVMMPLHEWERAKTITNTYKNNEWLKFGGLKGFVDGSLGSHTALFNQPYTDDNHSHGLYTNPPDSIKKWVTNATQANLQVTVHAIGDKANHFILNTIENIQKQAGNINQRFRVEHAQHVDSLDIPRFAKLNVIPSMQPYHAIDDGRWAEKVIGKERSKTSYALKSFFDSGAKVALGSDWFVAPPTPLEGIYAAVTRRTLDDKNPNGWIPEQKITVEQALKGYTTNAAYASFEENIKGEIKENMLADFVIIDKDLVNIPVESIKDAKILQTWVGGKMIYKQDN